MAAKYDILVNRGSDFELWFQYLTEGNTGINLSGWQAEMQIRRSPESPLPLLFATPAGLTYGYTGGITTGIAGPGGISLNSAYGIGSLTGGVYINFGNESTSALPYGRHMYDVFLTSTDTKKIKIMYGRAEVIDEVTE